MKRFFLLLLILLSPALALADFNAGTGAFSTIYLGDNGATAPATLTESWYNSLITADSVMNSPLKVSGNPAIIRNNTGTSGFSIPNDSSAPASTVDAFKISVAPGSNGFLYFNGTSDYLKWVQASTRFDLSHGLNIVAGSLLIGGSSLADASRNVTGGTGTFTNITDNGNTTLGASNSNTVTFNSVINSHLIPNAGTWNLGSSSARWTTVYGTVFNGSSDSLAPAIFESTEGSSSVAEYELYRNRTLATNDSTFRILFTGNNASAAKKSFGGLRIKATGVTGGSENGTFAVDLINAGTLTTDRFTVNNSGSITVAGNIALGSTAPSITANSATSALLVSSKTDINLQPNTDASGSHYLNIKNNAGTVIARIEEATGHLDLISGGLKANGILLISNGGVGTFADGSAANPAHSFASDADNGFYLSGTDQVAFATAGSQRWVVSATEVKHVGDQINYNSKVIRKIIRKTAVADNTATGIFRITTTNESGSNDAGVYSVKVSATFEHSAHTPAAGDTAVKQADFAFVRAMEDTGTGINSAVATGTATASAATTSGTIDISTVTATVSENTEYTNDFTLQVDLTGSGVVTVDITCVVEITYEGFSTAPTIAAL